MSRSEGLEQTIGLPEDTRLLSDQHKVRAMAENSATILMELRTWVQLQGIPPKSAIAAKAESLAKAYVNSAYLKAWRNNTNPNWALLGSGSASGYSAISTTSSLDLLDDDEEDISSSTSSVPPPAAAAAPPVHTEKFLRDLFAQIETTVEKLVANKIANTSVKLGDEAKAQIRTLAKTAAEERMEELAKPRRLEIHHAATGETHDLGLQHEKMPLLLRAVNARDHRGFRLNVWLSGPTGSGKTSAAEAVAKALNLSFGSDGSLDADYKVLGFRDANGNIISTQFLEIYENGGIYVADEIDNWMPSALLSLNAALANGWCTTPKGMVKRHPDACIIACANTWGLGATNEYVGRTRLDAASLDRFQPKIEWPVDERLEFAVADQQGGLVGQKWHDIVTTARHNAQRQGLKIIVSPRVTFSGISLLQQGFTYSEVADMTFLAGLSKEQKASLGLASALTYADAEAASPYGSN